MKKIFFLLITGLSFSVSHSQEVSDAVRYSQDNLTGTARFRALSGAFGAVGGDLSAITVNPAGSAIFNNNQVGITFSNESIKNNSNYFGTQTSDKENSFILNQAGGVFVFHDHNPNNKWKKIVLGASYENTNNFNNDVFSAGTNPTNSVDKYFLAYANGIPLADITGIPYRDQFYNEQQAYFGYKGYVINPVSDTGNNTQYITNVPAGGNYYHENEIYSRGYNSKLSFNIATSYDDRIYFGANLNAHITDYRRSTSFYEDNSNPLQPEETISSLRFNNDLYTYGNGFSFQLGAIAKVTEAFRLGIAYESNTWYELYDEVSQSLATTRQADGGQPINEFINPDVVNVYESYTLQTPGKFTFSGAYVFGKSGLISVDYSIKDYANTKYKPTSDLGFNGLNNDISNQLTSNGELRIGAEYKIQQLSLRGGYRFEGSPYKNGTTIGDLNSYSAGLGYSFGATKIDLAYSYLERKSNQGFFATGFTDGANISSKLNNVTLSLLFEL
ncbi:outer membrane protein transport protein [Flavobacterium sp. JLP]|uniref:OmpP1/FadL family transporter n=1 Tax=unclassified Flavobacterium TaxID=196869 RepID=UPI00188AC934|nr:MULTISPECIES: outer membrane protein transport protein [unclassified Flavobacterium]MBF4493476.1 outer membrane protein transport protein [Flavobacterium sp. MR2016-29]MBF4507989.1 outer membrane protein transport protein [Flavobacterium sp. JLP]